MALAVWFICLCITAGVCFGFEHPRNSRAWSLPIFVFLLSLAGIRLVDYDGCAFGLRPPGWTPSHGDVRIQNPSKLMTNVPHYECLRKKCAMAGPHKHERVIPWNDREKAVGQPSLTKHTSAYPTGFNQLYARCTVSAWKQDFKPLLHALPYVPLEVLQANIGATPEVLFPGFSVSPEGLLIVPVPQPVGQRATSVNLPVKQCPASASAASSSGGGGYQHPTEDFWIETDTTWVWRHVKPRYIFACVTDEVVPSGGPKFEDLTCWRETHVVAHQGGLHSYYVNDKNYLSKETVKHRKLSTSWIGSSVFHKKSEGVVPPEVDPAIVSPDSFKALTFQLSTMRQELQEAQVKDPGLKNLIACLSKEPAGTYLADPLRESRKTHVRASKYCLRAGEDGKTVLMRHDPDLNRDLPVVPEVLYDGPSKVADAPKRMTWKHLLLGAVHNISTAAHQQAKEMCHDLKRLVAWQRPWELRSDCDKWIQRCKLCTSVHHYAKPQPPMGTIRSSKPFVRLQWDLLEIKPMGENGETYVLTSICTTTKYPFVSAVTRRDSEVVAEAMFDVILDCGVVPSIHQSDNEFCNMAVSELVSLLGATQLFSTALRPQPQGLLERSHRDIRDGLAIAVESLCRAAPRRWPRHLRRLEYRLRHKLMPCGKTPYMAVKGFAGSTALESALGAFDEIPIELVFSDWLQSICEEAAKIEATLELDAEAASAQREQRQHETVPRREFTNGELVLVRKPFYEKGEGVILPQADGPYTIALVLDPHGVLLEDPLTGEAVYKGQRVSTARLIKFGFPQEWAAVDLVEDSARSHELHIGSLVCVRSAIGRNSARVHVGRVERFFPAQETLEVVLYEVPRGSRLGPWTRRPWEVKRDLNTGSIVKQVFHNNEILACVELQAGALTARSLELLAAAGVDISSIPTLDATLPDVVSRY